MTSSKSTKKSMSNPSKESTEINKNKLLRWGELAFSLARESEQSPAEISEFVAVTVGRQACRYGFTKEELGRWLQSAYSALWVRQSNLNPGLDMKDVLKLTIRAFEHEAR